MARRVLLFVQNGERRPKCVSWWPAGSGPKTFAEVQQRTAIGTVADTCWDGRPVWLVECENAEAGRATIAGAARCMSVIGWESAKVGDQVSYNGKHHRVGRILASGMRTK